MISRFLAAIPSRDVCFFLFFMLCFVYLLKGSPSPDGSVPTTFVVSVPPTSPPAAHPNPPPSQSSRSEPSALPISVRATEPIPTLPTRPNSIDSDLCGGHCFEAAEHIKAPLLRQSSSAADLVRLYPYPLTPGSWGHPMEATTSDQNQNSSAASRSSALSSIVQSLSPSGIFAPGTHPDVVGGAGFLYARTRPAGLGNQMLDVWAAALLARALNRTLVVPYVFDRSDGKPYPVTDLLGSASLTRVVNTIPFDVWRQVHCTGPLEVDVISGMPNDSPQRSQFDLQRHLTPPQTTAKYYYDRKSGLGPNLSVIKNLVGAARCAGIMWAPTALGHLLPDSLVSSEFRTPLHVVVSPRAALQRLPPAWQGVSPGDFRDIKRFTAVLLDAAPFLNAFRGAAMFPSEAPLEAALIYLKKVLSDSRSDGSQPVVQAAGSDVDRPLRPFVCVHVRLGDFVKYGFFTPWRSTISALRAILSGHQHISDVYIMTERRYLDMAKAKLAEGLSGLRSVKFHGAALMNIHNPPPRVRNLTVPLHRSDGHTAVDIATCSLSTVFLGVGRSSLSGIIHVARHGFHHPCNTSFTALRQGTLRPPLCMFPHVSGLHVLPTLKDSMLHTVPHE